MLGAIWIEAPSRRYVEAVKNTENFENGGGFKVTKRISAHTLRFEAAGFIVKYKERMNLANVEPKYMIRLHLSLIYGGSDFALFVLSAVTSSPATKNGGRIVREMILALVFTSVLPVMAVGIMAMWLTGDWRAFGLVILSAGLIGTGLVGYFHWRAKLRRQISGESDEHRPAA